MATQHKQRNNPLIIAIIASMIICVTVILFPPEINNPTVITATPNIKVALTSTNKPTPPNITVHPPTNTAPPSPIAKIDVLKWDIVYICGHRANGVKIIGAKITGGIPPYSIDAEYIDGSKIASREAVKINSIQSRHRIVIEPPINVSTGRWIIINIQSIKPDGNPVWTDQLYFQPESSDCSNN